MEDINKVASRYYGAEVTAQFSASGSPRVKDSYTNNIIAEASEVPVWLVNLLETERCLSNCIFNADKDVSWRMWGLFDIKEIRSALAEHGAETLDGYGDMYGAIHFRVRLYDGTYLSFRQGDDPEDRKVEVNSPQDA